MLNKEKLERAGFEQSTTELTYQLLYLAECWCLSPYSVNIIVRKTATTGLNKHVAQLVECRHVKIVGSNPALV